MKEKEQQIEEMAKEIFSYVDSKDRKNVYIVHSGFAEDMKTYSHNYGVAERLYNAGYRKIPQNARIFCPTADTKMVLLSREELERVKEQARKETAEKIWKEIAKKFGVEVKE